MMSFFILVCMKLFDFFSSRRQSTDARRAGQGISLACALLVCASLAQSNTVFNDLPSLGQQDIRTQNRESAAGLRHLRFLNARGVTLQDPSTTYYLEQSLLPLLPSFSDDGSTSDLVIFGVNHRSFNAFALPGGLIGIHAGLLEQLKDTSEVQAIMAHEMGHLALGHHERLAQSRQQSTGLVIASILLAPLAIQADPNLAIGMIYGAQGLSIQQQLAFSRAMEEEADRAAVTAMRNGGLPVDGVIGAYETMADYQRTQSGSTQSSYPGTHPNVRDRLADLRNRIDDSSQLSDPLPVIPLCWVQQDLGFEWRSDEQRCQQYTEVQAATAEQRAESWVELLEAYPANPYLIYRSTEWLQDNGNGDTDSLVDTLSDQALLAPDSWLTALSMLKLEPANMTEQNRRHWRSVLFAGAPANDLESWNTLRLAYTDESERGRAFRAQAQTSWINGEPEVAISQLRRAIELSTASSERQRWEMRLRSWQNATSR